MLSTILVPLDGSELAKRALPHATALARAARAKVVLVQALPMRAPGSAVDERVTARAELESVADGLRASGIAVETAVRRTHCVDAAISMIADEKGASLIVMSTHGRSGLGRWVYGSVADSVLRTSTRPILLVPAHVVNPWPADRPLRLLVPLDGSALAEEALAAAEQLAECTDVELTLLRIIPFPLYPLYGEGYAYVPFDEDAELAEAERYLSEQAERLRAAGRTVTTRAVTGQPVSVITAVSHDTQADIIVMATHGRGGLNRLMLGSVATGTVQRTTAPILLVRPGLGQPTSEAAAPATTTADAEAQATIAARPAPPPHTIDVRLSPADVELLERALTTLAAMPDTDDDQRPKMRALQQRLEDAAQAESGDPVGTV